tara:strand:+ start:869 stop:1681 length:813 start_codon:yes stop_codon:yes gene_type:complete
MGFYSSLDKRKVIYIGELIYKFFNEKKQHFNSLNEIKNINANDAYMVQNYFLSKIEKKFKSDITGWKLGLTSDKFQKKFNTHSPCIGRICNNFIFNSPKKLKLSHLKRVGVENEVAITLSKDIPYNNKNYTPKNILKFIKSFHSAIEIIDDKGINSEEIDIGILISMNIFNRYVILGEQKKIKELNDIKNNTTKLSLNNKIIAEGNTNNAMGDPINSLVWLANNVNLTGNFLKKNDVIITGTTLEPKWIKSNGKIKSEIKNIGTCLLEIE